MKKSLSALFLACALLIPASWSAAAETAGESDQAAAPAGPIEQFTGQYWINSTDANKEAYLFGIESAVEVEKAISERKAQGKLKKKREGFTLSPFERGWMAAFKDTPRKEIVEQVDAWYKANPDGLNRPVMDVIWYEVVVPRLQALKNK